MTATERHALVLAGGRGERFWPWSRPERPKQLLPLGRDGRSLLSATFERALRLVPRDHVIVITATDLIRDVARECPFAIAVREPVLMTFGIPADRPDINFGYIEAGARFGEHAHRVAAFKEKPDRT